MSFPVQRKFEDFNFNQRSLLYNAPSKLYLCTQWIDMSLYGPILEMHQPGRSILMAVRYACVCTWPGGGTPLLQTAALMP